MHFRRVETDKRQQLSHYDPDGSEQHCSHSQAKLAESLYRIQHSGVGRP